MPAANIIYCRTETGQKAWSCRDSGIPKAYRVLLTLVDACADVSQLVHAMNEFPAKAVEDWLDELETLCFIAAVARQPTGEEQSVGRKAA